MPKVIGMRIAEILADKGAICADILSALPEWFGLPQSNAQYARDAESLPMFGAYEGSDVIGMVVLKQHTLFAVENAVLGVRPAYHRRGAGRALIAQGESWARSRNARFLTVKTRGPSAPDANYEKTRAFYQAVGFVPVEEFPTLWDAANPCLFMVKSLD